MVKLSTQHTTTVEDAAALDAASFRRAMGNFASGVGLVTVHDEDGLPNGMTLTALCSVCVDPALLLVCVARDTRTHAHITRTGRFGVNILDAAGTEVSAHCSRPGGTKELRPEWINHEAATSTPVLRDALVQADCVVDAAHQAGQHTIFVGRIENLTFGGSSDPLLYFRGTYRSLAESVPVLR